MKALQFIYQDAQIHFLVNPADKNVMVNATEMAKPFNKEVDNFLRLSGTKEFIKTLLESENIRADVHGYNDEKTNNIPSDVRGYLTEKDIVQGKKRGGTLMHRKLALKFAAWLDVKFELWVIDTIDEVIFGNYKKHWKAHAIQEEAKLEMERLKEKMLTKPTLEINQAYFKTLKTFNSAKNEKSKAIRNQLKMMF